VTAPPDHAARAHVDHGASKADRWIACPGSIAACRGVKAPPSGKDALRGTAAHTVLQMCLEQMRDADEFVGRVVAGVEIEPEDAEAVQVALDFIRNEADPKMGDQVGIEATIDLAPLDPPVVMRGTADFWRWRRGGELLVVDYKHGVGVQVHAAGNPQLRYYALGVLAGLPDSMPVTTVRIVVVQPRGRGGRAVDEETIGALDLIDWAADLFDAARATLAPDAPRIPGDHCRWCPASPTCPAQLAQARALVQADFTVLDDPEGIGHGPPAPDSLDAEALATVLGKADYVRKWLDAVEAHARWLLETGVEVPGYKLVAGRASRAWVDEDLAADALQARGVDPYTKKILSPAQAEKALGKAAAKDLGALVVSTPGSPTIAPADDKRPAITPGALAAGDFQVLPD
jgi:hypothetical protein